MTEPKKRPLTEQEKNLTLKAHERNQKELSGLMINLEEIALRLDGGLAAQVYRKRQEALKSLGEKEEALKSADTDLEEKALKAEIAHINFMLDKGFDRVLEVEGQKMWKAKVQVEAQISTLKQNVEATQDQLDNGVILKSELLKKARGKKR